MKIYVTVDYLIKTTPNVLYASIIIGKTVEDILI